MWIIPVLESWAFLGRDRTGFSHFGKMKIWEWEISELSSHEAILSSVMIPMWWCLSLDCSQGCGHTSVQPGDLSQDPCLRPTPLLKVTETACPDLDQVLFDFRLPRVTSSKLCPSPGQCQLCPWERHPKPEPGFSLSDAQCLSEFYFSYPPSAPTLGVLRSPGNHRVLGSWKGPQGPGGFH